MSTKRSTMPGLTLLEVLLACVMLASLGMATVSLLRSLSDADRDRRTLILAPIVMAAANAVFDQRAVSHASRSVDANENQKASPTTLDPITIEIDAALPRWVVMVSHDDAPTSPSTNPGPGVNEPTDETAFAVVALRFEAMPDDPDWRGAPVVWWRLLRDRSPLAAEGNP